MVGCLLGYFEHLKDSAAFNCSAVVLAAGMVPSPSLLDWTVSLYSGTNGAADLPVGVLVEASQRGRVTRIQLLGHSLIHCRRSIS